MRVSESTREFKGGYVHIANCGLCIRICVYAHATMTACGRHHDSMPIHHHACVGVSRWNKEDGCRISKHGWISFKHLQTKLCTVLRKCRNQKDWIQIGYVQMANAWWSAHTHMRICTWTMAACGGHYDSMPTSPFACASGWNKQDCSRTSEQFHTSHMFRQMLAQCFASERINRAEIKAKHFFFAQPYDSTRTRPW